MAQGHIDKKARSCYNNILIMSLFTLEPAVLSSIETWQNCRIYADCHLNVCASRLGLVQTSYQYHGGIPNGTYNLKIN